MSHVLKPSSMAVDTLEKLFIKANNDLTYVQHKLEAEFISKPAGHVDPFKLMSRINRIQNELPLIQDDCQKIMAAKQDLLDKTKEILVANRALLRRMQVRAGTPICCDADDVVYDSFMKVLQEWNNQLKPGDNAVGVEQIPSEVLNEKLFSSLIQE